MLEEQIEELYSGAINAINDGNRPLVATYIDRLRQVDHVVAATHAEYFMLLLDRDRSDIRGRRSRLSEFEQVYREHNCRRALINILRDELRCDTALGEFETAVHHGREANALVSPEDPALRRTLVAFELGQALRRCGQREEAISYLTQAGHIARSGDEPRLASMSLQSIAEAYYDEADLKNAEAFFQEALAFAEQANDHHQLFRTVAGLAWVYVDTAEYPLAVEYSNRLLDLALSDQNGFYERFALNALGAAYTELEEYDRAYEYFRQILTKATAEAHLDHTLLGNMNIGEVLDLMGRHEESLSFTHAALEQCQERRFHEGIEFCLMRLMETYANLDDFAAARRAYDRLNIDRMLQTRPRLGAMVAAGRILVHEGALEEAKTILDRAVNDGTAAKIFSRVVKAHKVLRDIALAENDLQTYVKHNDAFIALNDEIRGQKTARALAVKEKEQEITQARDAAERNQQLLYAALPQHIADRMIAGEDVSGDQIDHAAVIFVDIAGFTTASSAMEPRETTALLEEIFTRFDKICDEHGVTKIKTIGDSYMAVAFGSGEGLSAGGLEIEQRAASAALTMLQAKFYWPSETADSNSNRVQFRIGLHVGPVVAGVIGTQRLQYDVWGDTVNTASRMESTGEAGKIQCSEAFAQLLLSVAVAETDGTANSNSQPQLRERGAVEVKGKGTMTTYWLESASAP